MKSSFVIVCFAFLIIPTVLAIGISSAPNKVVVFTPNGEASFGFYVYESERIQAGVEGDLLEYATLEDPDPDGGPRSITLKYKFPESLPSGTYITYVSALELGPPGATVAGVAKIRTRVIVKVLNPEKEVFFDLIAPDGNVDEKLNLSLSVTSFTTQQIDAIQGHIDVYDEQGNHKARVTTDRKSLPSDTSETLVGILDTAGFLRGNYRANATLVWDSNASLSSNKTFRIGTLAIDLVNYTSSFSMDTINTFELLLESDWNGDIKDIYAVIKIGNATIKTPSVDMTRFQKASLTGYWDTRGFALGSHEGSVEVFYAGTSKTFPVTVTIDKPKGVDVQVPGQASALLLIILIGVLALLVAGNIYFFVFRKKPQQ